MSRGCVLVVAATFAAAAVADEPKRSSVDGDLTALQGRWSFDPSLPKANAFVFEFDGKAVSFSATGPLASLPRANTVPFEITEAGGQRSLKLDGQRTPDGIGREVPYRLDGDRLVLTVSHEGKGPREYKLVRVKKGG